MSCTVAITGGVDLDNDATGNSSPGSAKVNDL
jgi:hypothetical protein